MHQPLSRRQFGAIFLSGFAFTACRPSPDAAEQFVKEFPLDISPDVKLIERTPVRGASTILIHMRTKHSDGLPAAIMTEADKRLALTVEAEVARITKEICRRFPIGTFVVEGALDEELKGTRQLVESYRASQLLEASTKRSLSEVESGKRPLRAGNIDGARQLYAEVKAHFDNMDRAMETDTTTLGLAYWAAVRHNVTLAAGETPETMKIIKEYHARLSQGAALKKRLESLLSPSTAASNSAQIEALTRDLNKVNADLTPASAWYRQNVEKKREDTVLGQITPLRANQPFQIALAAYGGEHHYKDNIMEWNLKNPRAKFALIEIDPKSWVEAA